MWIRSFILGLLLTLFTSLAWCETQDEKIKKLEQRIEQLEKQLAAATQSSGSENVEEIRRQLEILASEVEKLRSGEEEELEISESERQALGLGSSAATVYTKTRGPSLAGYGEMLTKILEMKPIPVSLRAERIRSIFFVR